MQKSVRLFGAKLGGLLAGLAMIIGIYSASSACWCWFHQPEVPEKLKARIG